ncbi:P-loop containing nucleoside triphosphate hydrolase protein [Acrodontium crateriforme]|uniref:P-loop containing nucleoside triphosphate hydrolase protein n=1 Tax=Acrodontium crateriforme TaxID=150365 RepID=A0AAQ3RA31_9PEZI|nr:P-loop containing nucleoside triphosphate hydrolase protein [Acrodontium crateriforme]
MAAANLPSPQSLQLINPTLHVEVAMKRDFTKRTTAQEVRKVIKEWLCASYRYVSVGMTIALNEDLEHMELVDFIEIAGYSGPPEGNTSNVYRLEKMEIDIQPYSLCEDHTIRDSNRAGERRLEAPLCMIRAARVMSLPHAMLKDAWGSLVFDDNLGTNLLRHMVKHPQNHSNLNYADIFSHVQTRMIGVMRQPGLHLATFNMNRVCLLHGPPGSGKSTLCKALAQKLSIRLGGIFTSSVLIEVNTNELLSKFFGESSKLIATIFDEIVRAAETDWERFVCVVIDEVETLASSREAGISSGECKDGMRAVNNLLMGLDKLHKLPNVQVLCTTNLLSVIDTAFLDRVDTKQLVPSPSSSAIYGIFRSCLNELVRSGLIDTKTIQTDSVPLLPSTVQSTPSKMESALDTATGEMTPEPPKDEKWNIISSKEVPTLAATNVRFHNMPQAVGPRVLRLAEKCKGLSGRTLRRLPIIAVAMHTNSIVSLEQAVSALEASAMDQVNGKGMP